MRFSFNVLFFFLLLTLFVACGNKSGSNETEKDEAFAFEEGIDYDEGIETDTPYVEVDEMYKNQAFSEGYNDGFRAAVVDIKNKDYDRSSFSPKTEYTGADRELYLRGYTEGYNVTIQQEFDSSLDPEAEVESFLDTYDMSEKQQ